MKNQILFFVAFFSFAIAVSGQTAPAPEGSSKFIRELGGLDVGVQRPYLLDEIAGGKIDSIEAGGGPEDWTEIDGRIFLTRRWMVEIGKIEENYSTIDFERAIAKAMQLKLESEGFKLTPAEFKLYSVRYQRGTTVGTLDVRTYFTNSGNLPFRMEFIFSESYLRIASAKNKVTGEKKNQ